MTLTITHNPDDKEFKAVVEGKTAFLSYNVSPDGKTLNYFTTFVPPEIRGRHIAQNIVKFALDYAKENNFRVIPSCPFVKAYIDRHPEYKDLLTD